MPKERITGSFVALITPFNQDGSVDYEGFRTLIDFHAAHGTSALLIMGSTGEVSMLAPEERQEIIRRTVKMRKPGMPLYYGVTGPSTDATIANTKFAAGEGADGAIMAVPSYICPSEADAFDYFMEVADASTIPLGIYNNPPRIKTDMSADSLIRLSKHENIVINKESTSRVGQVAQLAKAKPDMALMCCDSPNLGLVVPLMTLGGDGTANMSGNIIPREMARISKPWESYDDAMGHREAWLGSLDMLHFNYSAINPVPVKCLMDAVGLPAGPLRRPLKGLDPAHLQRGLDIIRDMGIADTYGYKLSDTPRIAAE